MLQSFVPAVFPDSSLLSIYINISSFIGPLPFSTIQCLTSQTMVPAISSNMETTFMPLLKPITSAWSTLWRWKPKTRYEKLLHSWPVSSWRSCFITLIATGGLHEVPSSEPGIITPPLWQGGQCIQHGNFHSREGQNQIHVVQSSCCYSSQRYLTLVWVGISFIFKLLWQFLSVLIVSRKKKKLLVLNPADQGKNAPALKNVEVIASVPCRSMLTPSYYHSFAMTDNYFVFLEQPFKLDILKMATAYMRGVNWASCLKFCPEESVSHHWQNSDL